MPQPQGVAHLEDSQLLTARQKKQNEPGVKNNAEDDEWYG